MVLGAMATQLTPEHEKRLKEATELLTVAHGEVEIALKALSTSGARGDKTIISEVLKAAFEKLTAARSRLEELNLDKR